MLRTIKDVIFGIDANLFCYEKNILIIIIINEYDKNRKNRSQKLLCAFQ